MIGDEEKEKVRQATDIVQLVAETVILKQRGQEFWGCCPFHNEKSPSFHVNPATGLWKCFGCGKGGDVFAYIMERENLEFPDAIRFLADRAGIEVEETKSASKGPKRNRLIECLEAAQAFYATMLMRGKDAGPAQGRSYLSGRGFSSDVCRRWKLGYAPGRSSLVRQLESQGFTRAEILAADLAVVRDGRLADRFYERVMFPIHDEQGRCIGFGGRVMGDAKPKYLNSKETPVFHKSKNMYAFDFAKEQIAATRRAIVVEGYTDVIAMHEAGFTNVVATLGTALTLDHVKMLARFASEIVCMFDGDAAGQKAADSAVQYLDKTEAKLSCVILPDRLDPAEFIDARGKEALAAELDGARPLIDFVFEKRIDGYDLTSPGVRAAALDEMASVLAPLKSTGFLLDEYAQRLADALHIDKAEVLKRIKAAKPQRERYVQTYEEEAQAPAPEPVAEPVPLSAGERRQRNAERELLCLLAARPDLVRPHQERIAQISWTDPRLEAMAWAMLSAPVDADGAAMVAAASSVFSGAAKVLSGGRTASSLLSSGAGEKEMEAAVEQTLDTVDLASTERKISAIRARLQSSAPDDDQNELLREATELQKHKNDVLSRLATGA